jgi:hypothetical protein
MSLSFRKGRSLQDQPYRSRFSLPKIINLQKFMHTISGLRKILIIHLTK